jgi:pyruvate dehydrogenase E1 component alpha subunit
VLFVCENNFYGIGTSVSRASALADIHKRTCGYDIPAVRVDGMDVAAVYEAVKWGAEWVREHSRPYLVEAMTYRFRGHSMADPGKYRSAAEVELWKARDPIPNFARRLLEEGIATEEALKGVLERARAVVAEAVRFAEESPWPEDDEIFKDIYV